MGFEEGKILIGTVLLAILFLLYNYLVFKLSGKILNSPKLGGLLTLPVGVFNAAAMVAISILGSASLVFITFFILIFVELILFHSDRPSRAFFVALICVIHFMAITAICSAAFSLAMGLPLHSIYIDRFIEAICIGASFALLCAAMLLVVKLVPMAKVRIICQHTEQLRFMTIWILVFCIYFLFNASVYSLNESFSLLAEIQILSSLAILIGMYIMLFFSFRIGDLLGYEESNRELRANLYNEKQYRAAIVRNSITAFEFSVSSNRIVSGLDEYRRSLGSAGESYTEAMELISEKQVMSEDMPSFMHFVSVGNLLKSLVSHKSEVSLECRWLDDEKRYIWVRVVTDIVKDRDTGEVRGFTYIKDIDEEKLTQLELKFRAERDSLTSLYNQGMTEKLVNERLENYPRSLNALFIVDIDEFKVVNKSYGHSCGDDVLRVLATRLSLFFRKEDVIGRIGGDEFAVFMINIDSMEAIRAKAQEICGSMRGAISGVTFSISVGISVSPVNGICYDELYKNADTALYAAKNSGKDSFTICV